MSSHQIRPIALCIFQRNDQILVLEGYDAEKQEHFYRPLGGGIEFGESSERAAVREIQEELSADICHLSYLGCLENVFHYNGSPGHEIVQLYRAEFSNPALYKQEVLEAVEDDGTPFKAVWKPLRTFQGPDASPLYPDGLLNVLTTE